MRQIPSSGKQSDGIGGRSKDGMGLVMVQAEDFARLDAILTDKPLAVSATGERSLASSNVSRARISLHYLDGVAPRSR